MFEDTRETYISLLIDELYKASLDDLKIFWFLFNGLRRGKDIKK